MSEVSGGDKDVFHLVDISVLTSLSVGILTLGDDTVVEDIGGTFSIGLTCDNLEVTALPHCRDAVVDHVLTCEVNHHRGRIVADEVYAFLEILRPILVVLRHIGGIIEMRD